MKPVVLHVRASNFLGGPERQLLGHAAAAHDDWYEVVLASFLEGRPTVEFLDAAREAGTRTLPLRSAGPFDAAPLRELAHFAQREPVALFVAHGYKAAAVCDLASRMVGRPWVGVVRGFTGENRKVRSFEALEMRLLRDARLVIAVSQGTCEMLARRGMAPDRLRTIPNAVDVDQWDSAAHGPRDYWVFAGRLSPEKNPMDALRALALRRNGARLVMAGEGPLRPQLEQEAQRLGLSGRVEFIGFRRDVRKLYAGALGLCLPSLREGLPNSVLEALSAGLPVVATRVGGVPELIRDGETGLLVEPGDPAALAAAMERIESDERAARELGARGRTWVREHFGFERQRERWDGVAAEVVRGAPRLPVPMKERLKAGLKERLGPAAHRASGSPVILTFHRVVDLEDPLEVSATCPWISLRSFAALLDHLLREFEVVPLPEILRSPARGRIRVSLTFDDGWRDNATVAAPALSARRMPWALFVSTAYAGTSRRMWQERLWEGALELFRRGEPMPEIWRGIWMGESSRSRAELAAACHAVTVRLKRWSEARREEILGTLRRESSGDAGRAPGAVVASRYLGPEGLRALHRAGVLVGSHGHSHAMLGQVEEERVREELARSTACLAEWLDQAPTALAYPDGSVTPRVVALAREQGYKLGLTTREGRVESDANAMLLPRVDVTEERLMGADGRFSVDRLRFELSRVP